MVFAMLGNVDVHLTWKRKELLTCEPALPIQATTSEACSLVLLNGRERSGGTLKV
jgi:hypothetical protein